MKINIYICGNKKSYIMTAMELNAQIWRDMAAIADSEPLMCKLAKYLKKLVKGILNSCRETEPGNGVVVLPKNIGLCTKSMTMK